MCGCCTAQSSHAQSGAGPNFADQHAFATLQVSGSLLLPLGANRRPSVIPCLNTAGTKQLPDVRNGPLAGIRSLRRHPWGVPARGHRNVHLAYCTGLLKRDDSVRRLSNCPKRRTWPKQTLAFLKITARKSTNKFRRRLALTSLQPRRWLAGVSLANPNAWNLRANRRRCCRDEPPASGRRRKQRLIHLQGPHSAWVASPRLSFVMVS